jgi:hypothetical protein
MRPGPRSARWDDRSLDCRVEFDPNALMLVRIAVLVAVDAPPVSYLLNLDAASEAGLGAERVRGVLAAVAPIVGTAPVASATGKIVEARPSTSGSPSKARSSWARWGSRAGLPSHPPHPRDRRAQGFGPR